MNQNLIDSICFEKANLQHEKIIFDWLSLPHIQEFWDNSKEHKDDILNFIYGRKQHYFYGTTKYWVGFVNNEPFAFLLSDEILESQNDVTDLHKYYLSKDGHTVSLDFGIGNRDFLGRGLAAPTLKKFTAFYHNQIDNLADTFFIDPDENNPRAKHVYEQAGFEPVGEYSMQGGFFTGHKTHLMVMKLPKRT
ncbi:TPA: GNAT family N-acetyltransferase [Legionella pneumophila subsp. pneumophila]|nr:GNAT family N-acetyltransferase [Legionella pneumophila subsp. pneumophila]